MRKDAGPPYGGVTAPALSNLLEIPHQILNMSSSFSQSLEKRFSRCRV